MFTKLFELAQTRPYMTFQDALLVFHTGDKGRVMFDLPVKGTSLTFIQVLKGDQSIAPEGSFRVYGSGVQIGVIYDDLFYPTLSDEQRSLLQSQIDGVF